MSEDDAIPSGFRRLAAIQADHEPELLARPNVVGVGLGLRERRGQPTTDRCVAVLVTAKVPLDRLGTGQAIPRAIDGSPVDVIEVGRLSAGDAWQDADPARSGPDTGCEGQPEGRRLARRMRPAMGGCSVGHYRGATGTVATGCHDWSPTPGIPDRYYLLSNNHVLARSNQAAIGDPIIQPGLADGPGIPANQIGRLHRYVPLQFHGKGQTPQNLVDAAIAEVPFQDVTRELYYVGYPNGTDRCPTLGTVVQKTGRTTSYSTGRIRVVNATVDIDYGTGRVARFHQQLVTTPMSAPGDSGSLLTDADRRGVGLLFAGSRQATVCNQLRWVEALLQIRLGPI